MAFEDFTTFTEVDPNSDITIASSTEINVDTMRDDVAAYVTKDYGAGNFTDFTHYVRLDVNSAALNGGSYCYVQPWALSNGYHTWVDRDAAGDGIDVELIYTGSWYLDIYDFSNSNNDSSSAISSGNTYYLTISRNGSTFSCVIYSDASRTIVVDSLSITCETTSYRYLDAVSSDEDSYATTISFDVMNLELAAYSSSSSSTSSSSSSESSSSSSSSSESSSSSSESSSSLSSSSSSESSSSSSSSSESSSSSSESSSSSSTSSSSTSSSSVSCGLDTDLYIEDQFNGSSLGNYWIEYGGATITVSGGYARLPASYNSGSGTGIYQESYCTEMEIDYIVKFDLTDFSTVSGGAGYTLNFVYDMTSGAGDRFRIYLYYNSSSWEIVSEFWGLTKDRIEVDLIDWEVWLRIKITNITTDEWLCQTYYSLNNTEWVLHTEEIYYGSIGYSSYDIVSYKTTIDDTRTLLVDYFIKGTEPINLADIYGLRCYNPSGSITLDYTDRITRVLFTKPVSAYADGLEVIELPEGGVDRAFGFSQALSGGVEPSGTGGLPHDVTLTYVSESSMRVNWDAAYKIVTLLSKQYMVVPSIDSQVVVLGW